MPPLVALRHTGCTVVKSGIFARGEKQMIHETSGDILLTRASVIAHGVSPNDDFHQGLALSLREKWPAMYKDFRHYSKTQSPAAGGLWSWMGADGKVIVNLFTQSPAEKPGSRPGPASLQHVGHALRELSHLAARENWPSIALPRLASGVGGLDWKAVRPLLDQHLGTLPAKVYVYTTFQSGVTAVEG
jgi:O-acetyl-ADP-ribose deacetylase (regulator of RNase III)